MSYPVCGQVLLSFFTVRSKICVNTSVVLGCHITGEKTLAFSVSQFPAW